MAFPLGIPPLTAVAGLGPPRPPCPAAGAVDARRSPARRSAAARLRVLCGACLSELEQNAEESRARFEIVTLHLLVDAEIGRPGAGELGGQPRFEGEVVVVWRVGGEKPPLLWLRGLDEAVADPAAVVHELAYEIAVEEDPEAPGLVTLAVEHLEARLGDERPLALSLQPQVEGAGAALAVGVDGDLGPVGVTVGLQPHGAEIRPRAASQAQSFQGSLGVRARHPRLLLRDGYDPLRGEARAAPGEDPVEVEGVERRLVGAVEGEGE